MCILKDKINAAGNDVLVNDNGALVHPHINDNIVKQIEKTFLVYPFLRFLSIY